MRKILLSVLFMFLSLKAFALQWSQVQGHLPGVPRDILAHPTNPSKLYLSTDKQLYENEKQKGWKRLFSVPGSHRIHTVYISALFPETLYVTSSKGLYVSKDAGHQWNLLFGGEGAAKEVISVCVDEQGRLWIGTVAGAFVWDERQSQWIPETGIPEVAIHQILSLPETKKLVFLTTRGIYLGEKGALSLALPALREETETSEEAADEDAEESLHFYSLVRIPSEKNIYALMGHSLWVSEDFGKVWTRFSPLPGNALKLGYSDSSLYLLTVSGAYQWNASLRRFIAVDEGLPDKKVLAMAFSRSGQYLAAATKKGVYKSAISDLYWSPSAEQGTSLNPQDLLRHFDMEPTISEIQNVAIQYAEVHPDKILQWRKQAARRAWLPNLGISRDLGEDNNIDVDRGGTGDQDKFIEGPADKTSDWSVDVSWDLGDLIWNNDRPFSEFISENRQFWSNDKLFNASRL